MQTRETAQARYRRRSARTPMSDPFDVPTRPFNSRVLAVMTEDEHVPPDTLERPWAAPPQDLPGERTLVSSPPEMMVLDQPPGRDTIPTAFPGVWLPDLSCEEKEEPEEEEYEEDCTTASFARPRSCADDVVSMTFPQLDDEEITTVSKSSTDLVSARARARARRGWQHLPWIVIIVSMVTTAVSLGGLLWV